MGQIRKRGGVWWIRYYVRGRRVEESAETSVWAEARDLLRDKEAAIGKGPAVVTKPFRFKDAAADIENDYTANARRSLPELKRRLAKHLIPFFGGRKLASISTVDVRAYIAKRQADSIVTGTGDAQRTRPVSNGEINRELTVLKRMFSLAVESGKLHHKPYIPMLKERNVRSGFFEREPFEAVRAHLPAAVRPLVTFMYLTGWRISEVTALEWRQVDMKAGTVTLDPGTTKNDQGRVFPFTRELRRLLEDQHAERTRLQQAGHLVPWVFVQMVGTRGSRRQRREKTPRAIGSFRKHWIAACRAAGCPGRIPHDFRRTAVRNLVRAGVPERVAMTMTGHKTRSVFERYNIVSPGDIREAARKVDAADDRDNGQGQSSFTAIATGSGTPQVVEGIGAGDGDRTRDIRLGKPAFYR